MGTRGSFGVVSGENNLKVSYNHFDSYPEVLGLNIMNDIKRILSEHGLEKFKEKAASLQLVNEDKIPTEKDFKRLKEFTDLSVSSGEKNDWYSLLRDLQGDLYNTLGTGVMIDGADFLQDSLFCEFAYIADVDKEVLEVLEVFRGFQQVPDPDSRFGTEAEGDYYPVKFVLSIPFDNIVSEDVDELVKRMNVACGYGDEE